MNQKLIFITLIITVGFLAFYTYKKNHPQLPSKVATIPSNNLQPSNLSCPKYSYTTDKIKLDKEKVVRGVKLELYRNYAYACSRSGYYTFLIAYPENISKDAPLNLWIRMHGGGAGSYTKDGQYSPEKFCSSPKAPCWIDEESLQGLAKFLTEDGLIKNVIKEGGFRFLVPSMCDHDFYSGIGDRYEQYNLNITATGDKNKAEGMLALRAAIDFTKNKYSSRYIFAHGTSAGSLGAATLAVALACEGKGISGVVADSGLAGPYSQQIVANNCSELESEDLENINQKIGPFTQIQPNEVVEKGLMKTPLFDFWTSKDWTCACQPSDQLTVTDKDGKQISGSGCFLTHKELDQAINLNAKNNGSTFREVCVGSDQAKQGRCSSHIPTIFSKQQSQGDLSRSGEDYNLVIMNWVRERLKDSLPNL